ncbi:UNKNOWN [Stylonychia lemnae]|uniref:Uncharacterized protein n=1 Tax=Stylonychia lemnae TaxID=5949 RepID=A0A078B8S2_STYLE|nr:UNKNOWN [Stylonychia lemnae]|eukprot:CDW89938.1 UNKNOWN [Stylonychia lemnae]
MDSMREMTPQQTPQMDNKTDYFTNRSNVKSITTSPISKPANQEQFRNFLNPIASNNISLLNINNAIIPKKDVQEIEKKHHNRQPSQSNNTISSQLLCMDKLKVSDFPNKFKKTQTNKFIESLKCQTARQSQDHSKQQFFKNRTRASSVNKTDRIDLNKDIDRKDLKRLQSMGNFKSFFDTQSKQFPISKFKAKNEEQLKVERNNQIYKESQFKMRRLLEIKMDYQKQEKQYNQSEQNTFYPALHNNDVKFQFKEILNVLFERIQQYLLIEQKSVPGLIQENLYEFKNLSEIVDMHLNKADDQELQSKFNAEQLQRFTIQEKCNQLINENADLHKEKNIIQFKYSETLAELDDLYASHQRLRKDYKQINEQRLKLIDQNNEYHRKYQEAEKRRDDMESLLKEKCKHLETTLIILQNTKIKLETIESQLKNFQNENHKLAVRGATVFTELTPRYDKFREVFGEFGIKADFGTEMQNSKRTAERKSSKLIIPQMHLQQDLKSPFSDFDDEQNKFDFGENISRMSNESDKDDQPDKNKGPTKIDKKYSSNQLIEKLVAELRKLNTRLQKMKEDKKKLINSQRKLNEQVFNLKRETEQYEQLKKKFTMISSQPTLTSNDMQRMSAPMKQTTTRKNTASNSGDITPMLNQQSQNRQNFTQNRIQSQIIAINDFGFGHTIPMQDEVSNQAKQLVEERQHNTNNRLLQSLGSTISQDSYRTQQDQGQTRIIYQGGGIIIEEENHN